MAKSIGNIIKERRELLGLSVDELAEKIKKSRATIYRYENGDIENLPTTILEPLAVALETTPAELMGWEKVGSIGDGTLYAPDQNNKELEQKFLSKLPSNMEPYKPRYQIPVLGRIAAGLPIYNSGEIEGYIDYDKDPGQHVFALRIHGDSMQPKILDGDIVIVDEDSAWGNDDIVAVTVNGCDGTCKKIRKNSDSITLIPINPMHDPQYFSSAEVEDMPVKVVGKIIELRRTF